MVIIVIVVVLLISPVRITLYLLLSSLSLGILAFVFSSLYVLQVLGILTRSEFRHSFVSYGLSWSDVQAQFFLRSFSLLFLVLSVNELLVLSIPKHPAAFRISGRIAVSLQYCLILPLQETVQLF